MNGSEESKQSLLNDIIQRCKRRNMFFNLYVINKKNVLIKETI